MHKFLPSSAILFVVAALVAVQPVPCFGTGVEPSGPSMFAPAIKEKAPAPPAAKVEQPSPEVKPERRPEPPVETASPPASPHITVDDRGNQVLVINGGPEPVTPPIATDESVNKTPVITGGNGSASPSIVTDEHGNKTLVIIGGDAAGPPPLAAGDPPPAALPDNSVASPWHMVPSAGPDESLENERPYWLADKPEDIRPYFMEDQPVETAPYWQMEDQTNAAPYWQVRNAAEEEPYWAPRKKEVSAQGEAPATNVKTTMNTSPGFSPAIHDASAAASGALEISTYMFKDEKGVVHISNVPTDPRYRLFTFKVEIKVQRGLAGTRTRFTHESLRHHIMKAAGAYNLDPALIAAIIKSESAFDAKAVSWAGAQGLMQLMPQTAREVGCRDPFDPEQNIMGGSRYLRWMLDRFNGNLDLAIAAYNAGPTRVAREWRIPNIAETQNYVKIVNRNYQRYLGEF